MNEFTMATHKVLRVAVLYPSDVQPEANDVLARIESVNGAFQAQSIVLSGIDWRNATSLDYFPQTIQAAIDAGIDFPNLDLVIGILWRRAGKKMPDGTFRTLHEINQAIESRKANGKPQICVFFKEKPFFPKDLDDCKQMARIIRLRKKLQDDYLRIQTFQTMKEFGDQINLLLADLAMNYLSKSDTPKTIRAFAKSETLRVEGLTEPTSDLHFEIKDALPLEVESIDVKCLVNTNLTSRLVDGSRLATRLTLLHEGTETQVSGDLIGPNAVLFRSVPVYPRWHQARIRGIRVNASQLRFVKESRLMGLIRISGGDSTSEIDPFVFDSNQAELGRVESSCSSELMSDTGVAASSGQPYLINLGKAPYMAKSGSGDILPAFRLELKEMVSGAFKTRRQEGKNYEAPNSGTRFIVLMRVPDAVCPIVTMRELPSEALGNGYGDRPAQAIFITDHDVLGAGGMAMPIDSNNSLDGLSATNLEVEDNRAIAVWEWIDDTPSGDDLRSVEFAIGFRVSNSIKPLPPVMVTAHLGPISLATTASKSDPIPRFDPTNITDRSLSRSVDRSFVASVFRSAHSIGSEPKM